jgi:hypothetical protein
MDATLSENTGNKPFYRILGNTGQGWLLSETEFWKWYNTETAKGTYVRVFDPYDAKAPPVTGN